MKTLTTKIVYFNQEKRTAQTSKIYDIKIHKTKTK